MIYYLYCIFSFTNEIFFLIFIFLFVAFYFKLRSPFNISCKTGFIVLNSFSFCLSVKLLISPSNLNESLSRYSILGYRFFSFITFNILCHFLLAFRVSAEKSAYTLMGVPLYVTSCFSLDVFIILFIFNFCHLFVICLGVDLFGFICLELSVFPGPGCLFLSSSQGGFQLLFLQINSLPYSLFLLHNQMSVC